MSEPLKIRALRMHDSGLPIISFIDAERIAEHDQTMIIVRTSATGEDPNCPRWLLARNCGMVGENNFKLDIKAIIAQETVPPDEVRG